MNIYKVCDPLFLESQFQLGGHTESTCNATVTFIKRNEKYYYCTCRHVLEEVINLRKKDDTICPCIHAGRAIWHTCNLFLHDPESSDRPIVYPGFRVPKDAKIDFSFIEIPFETWDMYSRRKDKSCVDLDKYVSPDFSKFQWSYVLGYPDESKKREANHVVSPQICVHVEIQSRLDPFNHHFLLQSNLDADLGVTFSGLSGGPIFGLDQESGENVFLGLAYEAYPGSKNTTEDSSLYGRQCMIICGLYVTPDIFDTWIDDSIFLWETDLNLNGYELFKFRTS